MLGARPLLGRVLNAEDDRPNGPPLAVIGYELWQTRFGGDRSVVGRRINLNDVPVEVIGVMPEGFRLPTDFTADKAEPTQLWRPLRVGPANLTRAAHTFYAAASLVERRGTDVTTPAAQFLFVVAPFSMLEPLAYLCQTGEYSFKVDWLYLAFALGIALLSHKRQRKSFYYAGLVNTGFALYLIALHRQWFDKFGWAAAIVAAGLIALLAGFLFDRFKTQKS